MTLLFQMSFCSMLWSGFGGGILILLAFFFAASYRSEMREARYKAVHKVSEKVQDVWDLFVLAYHHMVLVFTRAWHIPAVSFSATVVILMLYLYMKADVVECGNSKMAQITKPVTNTLLSCNCK